MPEERLNRILHACDNCGGRDLYTQFMNTMAKNNMPRSTVLELESVFNAVIVKSVEVAYRAGLNDSATNG